MAWVRLADDFYDHPKVLAAGPLAAYVWACGLAYANRYLTDGYLPRAAVRRLADVDDPYRVAGRLVEVGLWDEARDGWLIHDYAEYQPSAESVRHEREQAAERQRAYRERQKSGRPDAPRNGATASVADGVNPGAPYPVPVPYPVNTPDPAGAPSPLPPPSQAREGAGSRRGDDDHGTNPRRRRGRTAQNAPAPPEVGTQVPADLTPATDADRELWDAARDRLTDGWLPANAEKAQAFEPLGRDPSGWLWIKAPSWAKSVASQPALAAALTGAGDPFGAGVVLVEG